MNRLSFLLGLFMLLCLKSFSQNSYAGSYTFKASFGGSDGKVISNPEGGYYMTFNVSDSVGGSDCVFIKYTKYGEMVWKHVVSDFTLVEGKSYYDGLYCVGKQHGGILMKLTGGSGTVAWSKYCNFKLSNPTIEIFSNGNIVLVGGDGSGNAFIGVKVNTDGNVVWSRLFTGSNAIRLKNTLDKIFFVGLDSKNALTQVGAFDENGKELFARTLTNAPYFKDALASNFDKLLVPVQKINAGAPVGVSFLKVGLDGSNGGESQVYPISPSGSVTSTADSIYLYTGVDDQNKPSAFIYNARTDNGIKKIVFSSPGIIQNTILYNTEVALTLAFSSSFSITQFIPFRDTLCNMSYKDVAGAEPGSASLDNLGFKGQDMAISLIPSELSVNQFPDYLLDSSCFAPHPIGPAHIVYNPCTRSLKAFAFTYTKASLLKNYVMEGYSSSSAYRVKVLKGQQISDVKDQVEYELQVPDTFPPALYKFRFVSTDKKDTGFVSDPVDIHYPQRAVLSKIPDCPMGVQRYVLSEGKPAGGIYGGPGVFSGILYPSLVGVGNDTITYTYVSTEKCTTVAKSPVHIFENCGGLSIGSDNDVFPNPSPGIFNFCTASEIPRLLQLRLSVINVYSTGGMCVYHEEDTSKSTGANFLDLSQLPNGIYMFELITTEKTIRRKISINKLNF